VRQALQLYRSGQLPVDQNIRVPADRRREVRVKRAGQPVMVELTEVGVGGAEVLGLVHRPRCQDPDRIVEPLVAHYFLVS